MSDDTGYDSSKHWLRRLIGYCWRYRKNMTVAFGASLAGMALTAFVPLVQRNVVDNVIIGRKDSLALWAVVLLIAAIVNFATTFLRRYLGGRLSLDVQHDLRSELFGALSRLDGARQDELVMGQIVSRSTSDITMVQGLLSMMPVMSGNVLLFFISLVVMLYLSPLLTVVGLAVGPGLLVISMLSRNKLFPATWEAQQQAAAVAGVVEGAVAGVRVVKGFGQEEQELGKLDSAARRLFASRLRTVRLTSRYNPALQAIPALGQVGVLALGGWLAIRGEISIGTFLAFSTYLAQLIGPVRMLAGLLTLGQQARASVIRVFEVIDSQPIVTERPGALVLPHEASEIEFDDVRFGYAASRPVLKGLSLRVQPGETLALVGSSGSGKSTVSLLLPRFYDAQSGSVRIGGQDVRDLTLDSVRSAIGLVPEDSFLFSESVRANVAYGRPDATEDQIVAAAQAAEADDFIRELPDGYDTVVGEQGLTLSGGQRQRIALARALLTDPRILLLDDATSAVDARVEAEIHATLHRVMSGRTTLLIAHRRSTLQLADRIAVLDDGRVVDIGTQEELTERSPLYRLLLSGPGEDAEGVDAGELEVACAENEAQVDGVTPSLWDPLQAPPDSSVPVAAAAVAGRAGGGGWGGMLGSLPATPELLAQVATLPPATDVPHVDPVFARSAEPRFGLSKLVRPFQFALIAGLILVALDAAASLALPALIRNGVDHGVAAKATSTIWTVSMAALAIVVADWVVTIVQSRVTGRTGERILYALRMKTFAQLQRLGLDYYEHELSGRIMTRMTTDVDALSTFLQTGLTSAVISLLSFFGILVALLVINLTLGLTVLSVLPVLIVATLIFRAKSAKAYTEAREKVSIVNADLQENVSGMRIAQAYRREGRNRQRFEQRSDDYRISRMRAQRYIATYFPFVQFLSDIAGALVLIVGTHLVHSGSLTTGALIAYLLYIDLFFSPVQQLSQVFDGYQQAAVGLRRIRDLLQTPTSTPNAATPLPVTSLHGELDFADAHFAYEGAVKEALAGIEVKIRPGETVALVGETGAGKSTFVKMVARFYDPTLGLVLADQVDLRSYDLPQYRHRLGVVPQEAYLFTGTVRESVAYGRPSASNAEVEAAARAVGAHDMISHLEGGYYHQIADRGRNLSAGQRQLLALARAQLVDPDILLLDEATAALDLASEAAVTQATDSLAVRRTTLVVAHRLTTAQRAGRILVLDDGRVVEDGTHDELIDKDGTYAQLWAAFTGERAATA